MQQYKTFSEKSDEICAFSDLRAARAAAVAERMHQGYLARCVGKSFPVLFEQDRGEGSVGHAPNYMPVTVGMKGLHNTVQNVRITAVDGDGLRGEPEET